MLLNPTVSDLEGIWFEFIKKHVPEHVTVTFAEALSGKDGPRPNPPYVTIKVISGPRPRGFDELRREAGTSNFTVSGMRQYTLSIQGFGMGIRDELSDLVSKMDDPYASIERKGIGIVDRGDVVDISDLMETGYERRAQLDVIFNAAKNLPSSIKPIERASISGTLKEGNQGEHEVESFEVEKPEEP